MRIDLLLTPLLSSRWPGLRLPLRKQKPPIGVRAFPESVQKERMGELELWLTGYWYMYKEIMKELTFQFSSIENSEYSAFSYSWRRFWRCSVKQLGKKSGKNLWIAPKTKTCPTGDKGINKIMTTGMKVIMSLKVLLWKGKSNKFRENRWYQTYVTINPSKKEELTVMFGPHGAGVYILARLDWLISYRK